jgi:hypothetical protein
MHSGLLRFPDLLPANGGATNGLPLFEYTPPVIMGDRDGETFDGPRDRKRLDTAMERVFAVLKDRQWHTLRELADKAGCSETCASARIRDLRKPLGGSWTVEREYVDNGVWRYRWTGEKA